MANHPVTGLPAASTLTGGEFLAGAQSGVSVKISPGQIGAYVQPAVSVRSYGAIGDGGSHPLSTRYGTLAAAQVVYPFATALTQEIDYCACKAASNAAFGADTVEHGANYALNKPLYIPAGLYQFGADTWTIRNLGSALIYGDGQLVTKLLSNATVLAFDGLWYTVLRDFSILCQTNSATVALDIDGNVPGHAYATRSVQANTLQNMLIDGGLSTYAFAMCRQGSAGAQGSENLYLNVHLSGAAFACYYQSGFNALSNTFIGGNFQSYPKHGAYITGGTCAFFNTGFQSTYAYTQILNGGCDIDVGSSGAYEAVPIYGCRTESPCFLRAQGGVSVDLRGLRGNIAFPVWAPSTAFGTAAPSGKAIVKNGLLWVATTEGTTGVTEPTWLPPGGGTVADGSIVWTQTRFTAITLLNGSIDLTTVVMSAGEFDVPFGQTYTIIDHGTPSYYMSQYEDVVVVDATTGPVTVYLPDVTQRAKVITVKKSDTSANAVTLDYSGTRNWHAYLFEDGATTLVIPGGSRGFRTITNVNKAVGGNTFWLTIASG